MDREGEGMWKELNKEKNMIKILKIKKERKGKKAVTLWLTDADHNSYVLGKFLDLNQWLY